MTNEEWLKMQPTEIFVKFLTCKGCTREEVDEETEKCNGDCAYHQTEWLKAVHHAD